jgi:hypothetical protein
LERDGLFLPFFWWLLLVVAGAPVGPSSSFLVQAVPDFFFINWLLYYLGWDVSWRAAAAAGTSLCNQETKRNEKKSVCALFCFPGVFFWPCARVYTSRRGAHV